MVNKTDQIDETFRTFHMELMAGEDNTVTTLLENGCRFTFDFAKVYWNSRLGTEHGRVIHQLKPKDIALDMFAGVGPFSIPAAKKGVTVFANDLNPHSHAALVDNSKRNNARVKCYNLDGREFIDETREEVHGLLASEPLARLHVIMNLPAIAYQFLNCFRGYYNNIVKDDNTDPHSSSTKLHTSPPLIHCYLFSKSAEPEKDVLQIVEDELGCSLSSFECHLVRKAAPNKSMMRLTFPYPESCLLTRGEKREE